MAQLGGPAPGLGAAASQTQGHRLCSPGICPTPSSPRGLRPCTFLSAAGVEGTADGQRGLVAAQAGHAQHQQVRRRPRGCCGRVTWAHMEFTPPSGGRLAVLPEAWRFPHPMDGGASSFLPLQEAGCPGSSVCPLSLGEVPFCGVTSSGHLGSLQRACPQPAM